jgi:hypothetical protein
MPEAPRQPRPLAILAYLVVVLLFALVFRSTLTGLGRRSADWVVGRVPAPALSLERSQRLAQLSAPPDLRWCTLSIRGLSSAASAHDTRLWGDIELVYFCAGVDTELDDQGPLTGCFFDAEARRYFIDLAFIGRLRELSSVSADLGALYVLATGVASSLAGQVIAAFGVGSEPVGHDADERALRAKLHADFVAGALLALWLGDTAQSYEPHVLQGAVRDAREELRRYAYDAPRDWRIRDRILLGSFEQTCRWFSLGFTTRDLTRAAETLTTSLSEL